MAGPTIRVRAPGQGGTAWLDYTSQVPYGAWVAPSSVQNGGAAQGEFTVDDDLNSIPSTAFDNNLPAHKRVEMYDDGPGFNCYLAYGRIDAKEAGRGEDQPFGDARQWHVTFSDANADLDGLALTADWVRGAETDVARVLAAGAAFLNGSPRASTVITCGTAHLVDGDTTTSMPAKTYPAGTELTEILNDCAQVAGKTFGVVIHHVSDVSHMCFLYIDEQDHCTFASPLRISDDPADHDFDQPVVDAGPPDIVREAGAEDYGVSLEQQQFVVEGTGDDMLIVFVATRDSQDCTGVHYVPDTAEAGTFESFTQIGSDVTIGSPDVRLTAWKLYEPSASVQVTGGDIEPQLSGGNRAAAMYTYYLSGVSSSTVLSATDTDAGSSVSSDVTGTTDGHMLLDGVAWAATHGTTDAATAGSGQTSDGLQGDDPGPGAFGDPDTILATSHMQAGSCSVDSTMSWSGITSSADYTGAAHIAVGVFGTEGAGPTVPPIWDQGAAVIEEGQHLASKVISRHGNGTAFVTADGGTAITDAYDYWAVPYYDAISATPAQASTRATAILNDRKVEHVTHQVTIKLPASLLDIVTAGQSIQIKAAAAMGGQYLDTFQTRRVTSCKWEQCAPDDDATGRAYYAHLQLDRPMRVSAPGATGSSGAGVSAGSRPMATDIKDHGALTGLADDDHPQYIKDSEFGAKGRILVGTAAGTFDDLPVGTNDQVLTADSTQTMGLKWATAGAASDVGGIWQMVKNGSSQTLSNGVANTITFEAAGVDSGGSVIDLAGDEFDAPATGQYVGIVHWPWEGTAPGDAYVVVTVNGTEVTYRSRPPATPIGTRSLEGVFPLALTLGDQVQCHIHPGSVTGVTARGNAAVQLQTSFTLVRIA